MIVHVRMFAALRETLGSSRLAVEMPSGATVGQLRRQLAEQFPRVSNLTGAMMVAVNSRYAGEATEIGPNDDVACIPPVSGG